MDYPSRACSPWDQLSFAVSKLASFAELIPMAPGRSGRKKTPSVRWQPIRDTPQRRRGANSTSRGTAASDHLRSKFAYVEHEAMSQAESQRDEKAREGARGCAPAERVGGKEETRRAGRQEGTMQY